MSGAEFWPESFARSRARFIAALAEAGYAHASWSIAAKGPEGKALSIDVGLRRVAAARRLLLVTSGLHGVEAPFGAAAQLALLSGATARPEGVSVVLIHALSPFGFAHWRRWNEDGVDLNRNFPTPGRSYAGAPALYAALDSVLNPTSPPSRLWDDFALRAAWATLRFGRRALRSAAPVGQNAFPKGLFFGGVGPCETVRLLVERLPGLVGDAEDVLHLDLHTGLGPWGARSMLIDAGISLAARRRLEARFGAAALEASEEGRTAYPSVGNFTDWAGTALGADRYAGVTVEIGAYSAWRTLAALRAENRAWHWGDIQSEHAFAREALREAFAPRDIGWREAALATCLALFEAALA